MPRKPRLHVPGAVYHVILRGNNRRNLFYSAADRVHLNQLVGRATERLQAQVHAFCWMTNHLHLAVQVADAPLGRLMQWIGSRYAFYFNRRYGRSGHLFERRYRAILLDADAYLLELVRYIHRNPAKAGMVKDPVTYPWCSHRYYLGRGTLDWLQTDWVLSLFAGELHRARQALHQFVIDPDALEPPAQLLEGSEDDPRLAGGNELLGEMYDREYKPPSQTTLDEVIMAVCAQHGVAPTAVAGPGKQRHLARIRAEIARKATALGIATITDIGRRLNRSDVAIARLLHRYFPPA